MGKYKGEYRGDDKKQVLVFGLGAIGGFYASIISDNADVSVVARSNYDVIKASGLKLNSKRYGSKTINFKGVYKSVDETILTHRSGFDFIVCANKAIMDRPPYLQDIIRPAVGQGTMIAVIQNGIGNEDPLVAAFPNNAIISCVTFAGCKIMEQGVVSHFNNETMTIGFAKNADSYYHAYCMDSFASLLKGTDFTIISDVKSARWRKVVWNATWNSITALTPLNTTEILAAPHGLQFCLRLMDKVAEVARADGAIIPESFSIELISRVLATGGIYSSMKNDLQDRKEMEVEAILGNIVTRGKDLGVDVALIEGLLFPLRALQYGIRNGIYSKI